MVHNPRLIRNAGIVVCVLALLFVFAGSRFFDAQSGETWRWIPSCAAEVMFDGLSLLLASIGFITAAVGNALEPPKEKK